MSTLRRVAVFSFCLCAVAAIASADPIAPGSWYDFYFYVTAPTQATPSFSFTSSVPVELRVVDGWAIGDQYSIDVNGSPAFQTSDPSAWDGVATAATDGDTAWADGRLSHGEIVLSPGTYTIDEFVIRNASGFTYGEGFIRIDAATPEPGTLALFGLALTAVIAFRRRRSA